MSLVSQFFASGPVSRSPLSGAGITTPAFKVGDVGTFFQPSAAVGHPVISAATNGSIVAMVGNDGSAANTWVVTSTDGRTWTFRSMPTNTTWWDVFWTGVRFIATSTGATASAVSTDGVTWSSGPSMPSNGLSLYRIGARIVAFPVGNTATYYTSDNDGATWTTRSLPGSLTNDAGSRGCFVFGSMIYAPNQGAAIYRSSDAVTWETVGLPGAATSFCSNGSRIVAIGLAGSQFYSMSSTNGSSWSDPRIVQPHGASRFQSPSGQISASYGIGGPGDSTLIGSAPGSSALIRPVAIGSRMFFAVPFTTTGAPSGSNQWTMLISTFDGISWFCDGASGARASYGVLMSPPWGGLFFAKRAVDGTGYRVQSNPDYRELVVSV